MTQIINALSQISDQYDALFVDLWGCVHDGLKAFPSANKALCRYRSTGGKVILVTNSPKPSNEIEKQMDILGVSFEAWDSIASSGDSARAAMFQGVVGQKVYFIGEHRDLPFFEPMQWLNNSKTIHRVSLKDAEGIVCTGPFNPKADPEEMLPTFQIAKRRGLKLLCSNPDIVVDRGDSREWCAGALARLYNHMGGQSLYFGKPHPPIYDLARRRLATIGGNINSVRILAIGDGIQTDINGASNQNIDSLFISGGLSKTETKTTHIPDPLALNDFLLGQKEAPRFTIGYLQ